MAVGAPSLRDPRFLKAVIEIAVRGLPHAYRDAAAAEGDTVVIEVTGPAGGTWTLMRGAEGWTLQAGGSGTATTRVQLTDQAAWKLLFNALPDGEAAAAVRVDGQPTLAAPLVRARSVIV